MEEPIYHFYKKRPEDKTIWVDIENWQGWAFTFDKKKIYYLYRDYRRLSLEEKQIFDSENPFWAEYFNNQSES